MASGMVWSRATLHTFSGQAWGLFLSPSPVGMGLVPVPFPGQAADRALPPTQVPEDVGTCGIISETRSFYKMQLT